MSNLCLSTPIEDHSTDLLEKITSFFKENVLTDVTLVCEDHTKVEAHKVILGAVSPTFREMLCSNHHSHPLIFLKGVSGNELKPLLDFIYFGKTSIQQDSLEEFMKIGKSFEVSGLGNTSDKNVKNEREELGVEGNETMVFPCEFCDFKTKDIEDLNLHKMSDHPNTDNDDDMDVNRGEMDKNNDQVLACVQCSYIAKSQKDLKFHNKYFHVEGRFKCDICENSYSQEASLRLHHKVKHTSGTQRLKCDLCELSYTRVDSLREHVMTKHENTAKFFCKLCDFKTMRPAKLEKHVFDTHQSIYKVKDTNGTHRLKCDLCELSYNRVDNLREHVMTKHENTAKFFCELCDFKTMRPAKLEKHIIDTHK